MRLTTLCYIEKDGKYLMLHRTKKKNDENHDKWIGVGGKFEPGESPDECLIREVKEETGLTLITYQFRGIVTFCSDEWEDEYMHLFTATEFERRSQSDCVHEQVAKADCECPLYGELTECSEGDTGMGGQRKGIVASDMGGRSSVLERLLSDDPQFFSLKVVYEGEHLAKWTFY